MDLIDDNVKLEIFKKISKDQVYEAYTALLVSTTKLSNQKIKFIKNRTCLNA